MNHMEIPMGYCQCGCGQPTSRAKKTGDGYKKGQPVRFLPGHFKPKPNPNPKSCSIEGCENKSRSKGYCRMHYNRLWSKNLDMRPALITRRGMATEDRFYNQIRISDNGCWIWIGTTLKSSGYGIFHVINAQGKWQNVLAHLWSYKHFGGRIPEGFEIHHQCTNVSCVNPEHLETVTKPQHMMKSNWASSTNARKTHCIHGHSLADAPRDKNGDRYCRICATIRMARYRDEKRREDRKCCA